MGSAFNVGAGLQCSAIVLAIVALSPAPLALPSGIAVASIGLTGAVLLLARAATAGHDRRSGRCGLHGDADALVACAGVLRHESGERP